MKWLRVAGEVALGIAAGAVIREQWLDLPVEVRDLTCLVTCVGGPLTAVFFFALASHGKNLGKF